MEKEDGKKRTCPHCGSDQLDLEGERLVCMKCGAVIEDNIVSSEQEQFYSYKEALEKGKHSFAPQARPKTKTDWKNLRIAISLMNDLVNKLHLPYFVKEEAIEQYKRLMKEKKIRKDVVPSIAAALIYLICRKSKIPIPLERVAEESEADKSDIASSYMEIIEKLKIEVPPPSIEGLTILLAKKANLTREIIALAREMANKLEKELTLGKDPNSIAAAVICLAAKRKDEKISKSKMAQMASVSSVTLRNQILRIEKALKE